MEEKRAKLADEIALRESHLRADEASELLRRLAQRLRDDITAMESKLAITLDELAAIEAKTTG